MKTSRLKLTSFALASVMAGMCMAEDAGVAEAQAGVSPETPAAAEARKRAAASNFLPIVRGRLPLIFVHGLRFDDVLKAMGNKDAADKFGTSVGKVFDIRKNRNFSYVTAEFKPTAEDVAAAEGWIAQVGATNAKGMAAKGDTALMQKVLDQYKERGMATAEEAAAFSAGRGAARKVTEKPAATATATAPAGEAVQKTAGSADDLLA